MSWRSSSISRDLCAALAVAGASFPVAAAAQTAGSAPEPPSSTEVTVRAPPRRRDPARVTVRAEEARRVPGARDDALQVVESLPGVARPSLGGGQFVLWGAAPGDSRVYVDGVEVPALYHGAGLRGVLPSDLVESIDLVPGAYGADYGRGLGGLVRVQTRPLPAEGVHASLGADVLDASGMVTAAAGDRLRVGLAGRVSYLDRIASAIAPAARDVYPIPRYHDYQAKLSLTLREDEELTAVLLGSGDDLARTQRSPDLAKTRAETTASSFQRFYLRYTRTLPDGASVVVTPFFGRDRTALDAHFGAAPAALDVATWRYGLRASYRAPLARIVTGILGADVLASRSSIARRGSLTLPPREGDLYVFGQPPGDDVNADDHTCNIVDAAPFVGAEVTLGPVVLSPGLRLDGFLVEGSRQTPRIGQTPGIGFSRFTPAFAPRLSASWAPSRRAALSASGGLYHQAPAPEDLGAVFGTPALGLSRAVHVSVAEATRLFEGLDVEVTGFYKHLDHLVVRSRLPTPTLAQALTQDGEGRSYGAQILVRRQLRNGLHGWLAYTASRSERRYRGDPGYRLFDYDQTHVLTAVAGYTYRGWGFGARFRYTSGWPRTPVVGSFHDATFGRFQPIFGAPNAIRLPDFYALDLRVEKAIPIRSASLDVYLDVLNATYHRNAEEIVYSYDFTRRSYITGLPTLAILGARVRL